MNRRNVSMILLQLVLKVLPQNLSRFVFLIIVFTCIRQYLHQRHTTCGTTCNMARMICELHVLNWQSRLNHHTVTWQTHWCNLSCTGFTLCLLHTICNTAAMRAGDNEQSSVTMVQTVQNVYFHDYLYDYDYACGGGETIATMQHGLRIQGSPSTHWIGDNMF